MQHIKNGKKNFTTSEYNKFSNNMLDAKITEKKLLYDSCLDEKIKTWATKEEFKAKQDKIVKLEMHDWSYFLCRIFFDGGGSQNMFVYQLTFITLELKVNKNAEYFIGWKSEGLH